MCQGDFTMSLNSVAIVRALDWAYLFEILLPDLCLSIYTCTCIRKLILSTQEYRDELDSPWACLLLLILLPTLLNSLEWCIIMIEIKLKLLLLSDKSSKKFCIFFKCRQWRFTISTYLLPLLIPGLGWVGWYYEALKMSPFLYHLDMLHLPVHWFSPSCIHSLGMSIMWTVWGFLGIEEVKVSERQM
jgi:hypothetical protein